MSLPGRAEAEVVLDEVHCGMCGIVFAPPAYYVETRRALGDEFFCPNGHKMAFAPGRVARLNEELVEAAKQHTVQAAQIDDLLGERRRLLIWLRRGQCPWCKKKVGSLRTHLKKAHPTLS